MDLFNLSAVLNLDKSGFEGGVREANREGESLGKRISAWTIAGGKMIADYAEKAVDKVISISRQALTLSGELEQQVGGVKAVFSETYGYIQDAADSAYKHLGLSKAKYLAEANKMGSLLKGMGFEEAEAAEMTMKWMERAADVASIMGISTADAMVAIEGAAKGNFTMMDNLGVAMNATTLEAYALSKGITTSYKNMSQAEKIGLAYQMFMEKTASYERNFTKENATFSGSLAVVQAAWENLLSGSWMYEEDLDKRKQKQEEVINGLAGSAEAAFNQMFGLAQELLPAVWDSLKRVGAKLWPKVSKMIGGFIKDLPKTMSTVLTGAANGAIDIINAVFGIKIPHIKDIKLPSWEDLKDKANEIIKKINEFFGTNIPELGSPEFPSVSLIIVKIHQWWKNNDIAKAIQKTCTWVLGIFGAPNEENINLTDVLGQWWTGISGAITNFCTWVLGLFTGVSDKDGDGKTAIDKVKEWFGGIAGQVGDACKWVLGLFSGINDKDENGKTPADKVGEWFGTIAKGIGDACIWTIACFAGVADKDADGKSPAEKVSEWWGGVVQSVIDTCKWVLGIFTAPSENLTAEKVQEILGMWWGTAQTAIQGACTWMLGLFDTVDGDGETAAGKVKTWFDGIADTVAGACTWTLHLFGLPQDSDATNIISGFLQRTVAAIGATFKWAVSLPQKPTSVAVNQLGQIIGQFFQDALKAAGDLLNWLFNAPDSPDADAQAGKIKDWWKKVIAALGRLGGLVLEFTVGLFGFGSVKEFVSTMRRDIIMMLADLADELGLNGILGINTEKMREKAQRDFEYQQSTGFATLSDAPYEQKMEGGAREAWDAFLGDFSDAIGRYAMEHGEDADKVKEQILDELEQAEDHAQRQAVMDKYGIPVEFEIDDTSAEGATDAVEELGKTAEEVSGKTYPLVFDVQYNDSGFSPGRKRNIEGTGSAGSNAKGLDYVPYDDYLTTLHKGEAVLSGNEARSWRESGGRGQGYGDTGAIVTAIQGLSNDLQNLRLYVGERAFAGAVVDYSGRRMNGYLGESSTRARKGYGRR